MKRLMLTICAASFLLFACNSEKKTDEAKVADASATEKPKDEPWVVIPDSVMWAKMQEYGKPGPMHQMLASWSGTWTGETTMWDYEGAPAQKSTGTAVNEMILGGKYQRTKHSGTMMGMPFEGLSMTGYDNATKQFTSTWMDNWNTGIMTMTGSWDEASKTLTMSGTYPDIFRPGKECKMREVFKVIDDNNQVIEMYGPDQKTGKEFKMMEIKSTRKK
ncbi:MAG TPA: DUF1579 domain-containing protein [Chitinophagaceae bacterium]